MSDEEMDTEGTLTFQGERLDVLTVAIDFNGVFDPDQDPEEKRAVRQNYRSLAKKIEGRMFFVHLKRY